jgi:hypothetical protein
MIGLESGNKGATAAVARNRSKFEASQGDSVSGGTLGWKSYRETMASYSLKPRVSYGTPDGFAILAEILPVTGGGGLLAGCRGHTISAGDIAMSCEHSQDAAGIGRQGAGLRD